MKNKKIYNRRKTTEYQLGWIIGEVIYMKYLPTLDIDLIHSPTVIRVTPEEYKEYVALNEKWESKYIFLDNIITDDESTKDFENLKEYRDKMAIKYLPNNLQCSVPLLMPTSLNKLNIIKEGIRDNLWNSDLCWYNIDNNDSINIIQEDYFTLITLKLKL